MKFRRVEHPFERALAVSKEELAITLRGMDKVPWAEFFLNPRRLRGSDFLMRWSQGAWSEERLTEAVSQRGWGSHLYFKSMDGVLTSLP